ncbi:MAG: hypothetical protein ACLFQK_07850 [Fibrobacterota bacterium]
MKHLSDFTIEKIICGELDLSTSPEISNHLEKCTECREKIENHASISEGFHEKFPDFASLHKSRKKGSGVITDSFFPPALIRPLAAAAVIIFSLTVFLNYGPEKRTTDIYTAKGSETAFLALNGKNVSSGDTVFCGPGDTIQPGIISDKSLRYLVMYSDDGKKIRRYIPRTGTGLLKPEAKIFENSIILGGEWKTEKVFIFWSEEDFDENKALECAKNAEKKCGALKIKMFVLKNKEGGKQ